MAGNDPTLEQMLAGLESRQAARPASFLDLVKQLLYPKAQAPINQPLPQFDAQGNPIGPRNLNDLIGRR